MDSWHVLDSGVRVILVCVCVLTVASAVLLVVTIGGSSSEEAVEAERAFSLLINTDQISPLQQDQQTVARAYCLSGFCLCCM